MNDAIASAALVQCEACQKWKRCKLFVLQNGQTAWVCDGCRNGK